jgi:hypothetical protein
MAISPYHVHPTPRLLHPRSLSYMHYIVEVAKGNVSTRTFLDSMYDSCMSVRSCQPLVFLVCLAFSCCASRKTLLGFAGVGSYQTISIYGGAGSLSSSGLDLAKGACARGLRCCFPRRWLVRDATDLAVATTETVINDGGMESMHGSSRRTKNVQVCFAYSAATAQCVVIADLARCEVPNDCGVDYRHAEFDIYTKWTKPAKIRFGRQQLISRCSHLYTRQ